MKMLRWSMLLAIIPVIALSLSITGCGGKDEKKPGGDAGKKSGGDAGKKEADAGKKETGGAVEAKIDAVLTGKVSYDGKAPEAMVVASMKDHKDKATCTCDAAVKKHADVDQTWLVSKDGGVANVVVILEPVAGKLDVPADLAAKLAKESVTIDQPYCAFEPHVVALFKGQTLVVKNSADVVHNTKLEGNPLQNPTISKTIPPKGSESVSLKPQSKNLSVKCDIHPWMSGSVWVFDHPFFAVTKEDGTFEIKNAPSGVELRVSLWHEATNRIEATKMTLKTGDNKANDLKIKK